jgi:hypothetical protein
VADRELPTTKTDRTIDKVNKSEKDPNDKIADAMRATARRRG